MVLEHVGMPQPGDCRVVFSASAEELEAAIQAEQAAENPPQTEEDLLTAAVNRAILTGFSTLYQELVEKEHLVPVTDPDFELLAVNRAEGFRAGAEFYCLPPLKLERYTGFTQPIQPRPIRQVSIELEVNTRHGDEDRAADAAGKAALRQQVARELYTQRCAQAKALARRELIFQLGGCVRGPLPQGPGLRQAILPNSGTSTCGCRPTTSTLTSTSRCGARLWNSSALSFTHRQSRSCGAIWAF